MNETVAKLAGLSLLLIAVWIAVYWITPAEPRVTFADLEAPGLPAPTAEKRFLISGSLRIFVSSALSRAMMAGGVLAGAIRPVMVAPS